ncbi:branched-chain amino acid ABC transporter substrate-binding protein [Acuticoccus sediminis]|uniref:Branched-chain amino acid ABC transporter substrate-binding protein n=1 Tax=Acuticoccus sediminis TaxID=2184697 RepID=A0A8B2NUM7_9HYPH|nr:ABC transporter substrate-binding protein [Acuticoccus sediminis]RAH99346.1 branched-chain amino acid ABC transporter substrate-binding protein [Acuticoccus sediminis]
MAGLGLLVAVWLGASPAVMAAEADRISIGYIFPAERELTLSILDRPTADFGLAGAELAIADNNTTGRFTGQEYKLLPAPVEAVEDAFAAIDAFAEAGAAAAVVDLPAEELVEVAAAAAERDMLVFNVGAPDDRLRVETCPANVVHIVPSRAMLADALAQFLAWKKWNRWFLVTGSHPEDAAFAAAIKRAAARFGGRIVEERVFEDTGGARTTDSGHVQVQRRLPVFLQGAPEHDVVIVADESEVFGTYVPYNTWSPRPVAGTAGLVPTAWSPAHEQWAGIQVQNRFRDAFNRRMQAVDMLAWMAVRAVGEAATRASTSDPAAIRQYILGPDFELAAFKGEALTIRDWNRQLRQPILLTSDKFVVSVSPQEGFLHPTSFLDTLGYDRAESRCAS